MEIPFIPRSLGWLLRCAAALGIVLALNGCEPAGGKRVELVYVEWSDAVASTNVVRVVLEDMGYEVQTTPVSAAAMWQAVASGDADGMVAAWLPTTHGHYLEATKDKIVNLGPNLEGTRIGLVVPAYVEIDSIEELNAHAERFNGKIIGIDPGAGLMSKSEKALEAYGLKEMTLVEGSGATMTAALSEAVRSKEWIVVTGWTPHWKFRRWDLKYLEDPRGTYGEQGHIATVVRKGLKKDLPEVYRLLDRFHWKTSDVEALMAQNQQPGADPHENARQWVREHVDTVRAWLGG